MGDDQGHGWVEDEQGVRVRIDNAEEWGWIQEGRIRGAAWVLSCADRFSMPPHYYPVFLMPGERLPDAKREVESGGMQEVLAVFRLSHRDS